MPGRYPAIDIERRDSLSVVDFRHCPAYLFLNGPAFQGVSKGYPADAVAVFFFLEVALMLFFRAISNENKVLSLEQTWPGGLVKTHSL